MRVLLRILVSPVGLSLAILIILGWLLCRIGELGHRADEALRWINCKVNGGDWT